MINVFKWNAAMRRRTEPDSSVRKEPFVSWGVLAFTLGYMMLGSWVGMGSDVEVLSFYGMVLSLLIAVIVYLHWCFRLSVGLLWGLSLWGFLHTLGGILPIPAHWPHEAPHAVCYSLWLIPDVLKYDNVVHAFGFGLSAWLCWQVLVRGARMRYGVKVVPTIGALTLCAFGGMGFGAFNELVEFIAVLLFPDPRVGGYYNTGWDLVANAVGSIVAMTLVWWGHVRQKGTRSQVGRREGTSVFASVGFLGNSSRSAS